MKLHKRVILVTGASKGIGAAIAVEAAHESADVIINYSADEAGAFSTLAQVEKRGGKAMVVRADVTKKADVEDMVAEAVRHFGTIDILVNNAGIALWKPFWELDEDNWDRTLDTNLKGPSFARRCS